MPESIVAKIAIIHNLSIGAVIERAPFNLIIYAPLEFAPLDQRHLHVFYLRHY